MVAAVEKQIFCSQGTQIFTAKEVLRNHTSVPPFVQLRSKVVTLCLGRSICPKFPLVARQHRRRLSELKVYGIRRRRSNTETDMYVLMEPGKAEVFVTEDELREKLKGWLENWPGTSLPPDLARFESVDDAVSHLLKFVCELEIDGDVGTIQWYQVRMD